MFLNEQTCPEDGIKGEMNVYIIMTKPLPSDIDLIVCVQWGSLYDQGPIYTPIRDAL